MIGDSIRNDQNGANNAGIDSYLVDENHTIRDLYNMIINENNN